MFSSKITSRLIPRVYKLFARIKRERRYAAALTIIKHTEPLLRFLPQYKMPYFSLGTQSEFTTAAFLNSLTLNNVEFDPELIVGGAGQLEPGGAIFISCHFYLNFVFLRWLHDNRRDPLTFILLGVDDWRIIGTDVSLKTLLPDAAGLRRARRALKTGGTVVAAIDHTSPGEGWVKLNIPGRAVYISQVLLVIAEKEKIPLYFFDVYLDQNSTVAARMVKAASHSAAGTIKEFEEFIIDSLVRRAGRD